MISMKKRQRADACKGIIQEIEREVDESMRKEGKSLKRVLEAKERKFLKL